jgi:hypothetical protein
MLVVTEIASMQCSVKQNSSPTNHREITHVVLYMKPFACKAQNTGQVIGLRVELREKDTV